MKKVKFTEVEHQWEGMAIVRENGVLKEIPLGVKGSDKKLKETGAKELFKDSLPDGTITVEVKKNADITTTYEMDSDEFKKVANLEKVPTEEIPEEKDQQPATQE